MRLETTVCTELLIPSLSSWFSTYVFYSNPYSTKSCQDFRCPSISLIEDSVFFAKLLWIILLKYVELPCELCVRVLPFFQTKTQTQLTTTFFFALFLNEDSTFMPMVSSNHFFFFQHVSSLNISDWSDCVMISLSSRFLRKREQILKYNSNNNNLTLDAICTETCLCVIPFYVLNWLKLFYDALKVNIYCL